MAMGPLKKKLHSIFSSEKDVILPLPTPTIPREALTSSQSPSKGKRNLENPSVDQHFYTPELDASLYQLQQLPLVLDPSSIQSIRSKLHTDLEFISQCVFQQICTQRNSCDSEMKNIESMTDNIQSIWKNCVAIREELKIVHGDLSHGCLELLAAVRRRQQSARLLSSLKIIRTLQRTDTKLQQLINEEDYPNAIQLIIECQNVALTFGQFYSISQLSSKLQDTLAMTEEALDVALAQQIVHFDENTYTLLYEAYSILGKKQVSLDQLLMHLISTIHNTSWRVVFTHTSLNSSNSPDNVKETFDEICCLILPDQILPCLLKLCSSLWNIMYSYRKIVNWHETRSDNLTSKLKNGLVRVWADVQSKIRVFVSNNDLSQFKIETFLKFMDVIHRLIQVGHLFCGSDSDTLQESLKQQCWTYFASYHQTKLEELKVHLDNESWKIIPVKSSFKVSELSEYNHLKDIGAKRSVSDSVLLEECPFQNYTSVPKYSKSNRLSNAKIAEQEYFYDVDSDDSDVPDDLKKECLEEEEISTSTKLTKNCQFLTNTSLEILRLCGNYLELMKLLNRIAQEIFESFCQLIELYAFTVNHFFTQDLNDRCKELIRSFELNNHLSRIEDSLFNSGTLDRPKAFPLSSTPENLFGLCEKITAVESVLYLGLQLQGLKSTVSDLIPIESVQKFYNTSVNFLSELRKPIYMSVCGSVSNYDHIIHLMDRVSWDIKEVQSQHSHYVDVMLRELQMFSIRLEALAQKVNFDIHPDVQKELWNLNLLCASHTFVDGFSNVKNCSNEGRALMQLDYRQFVMKIEKVTCIKPVPFQEYVSTYIKAFYISEVELEDWVQTHTEYSSKHKESLVNCVAYQGSKTKQKFNNLITDLSVRLRNYLWWFQNHRDI